MSWPLLLLLILLLLCLLIIYSVLVSYRGVILWVLGWSVVVFIVRRIEHGRMQVRPRLRILSIGELFIGCRGDGNLCAARLVR